jgi:integrase
LRSFGIEANPVASVGARALSKYNRARKRVLDASEMGAFLRRVDALHDGAQKDVLRLLLFLGGQRPMQLLRVTPADIDLKAGTITLYDGKGSRCEPRRHVLPLVKQAAEILERRLQCANAGIPLFSTDDRTTIRHETLSVIVGEISAEMVKAKEAREDFELRDLRRTALHARRRSLRPFGTSEERATVETEDSETVQNCRFHYRSVNREAPCSEVGSVMLSVLRIPTRVRVVVQPSRTANYEQVGRLLQSLQDSGYSSVEFPSH